MYYYRIGKNNSNFRSAHITKEILIDLYLEQKKSSTECAQHLKVSKNTIFRNLRKYNISVRSSSEAHKLCKWHPNKKIVLPKNELQDLYNSGYTIPECAKYFKVSWNVIHNNMLNYSISARDFKFCKGRKNSKEHRETLRKMMISKYLNSEEREKQRVSQIQRWKDPEYINKVLKANSKKPNKLESYFDNLTPDYVRYVGNGKWWRKIGEHYRNPDFKIKGQNKIIEIFGDYWHKKDNPDEIIREYKKIGLDCLIFWETEIYNNIKEILNKVECFARI